MMMVEARSVDRVRSFLRARIVYNNGNSTLECVIKNISATGAKLELSSLASIPAEFDIDIPQKGRVYRARIMWRDTESAGIQFMDGKPERGEDELEIERLRRENKKLKATITEMARRLDELGFSLNTVD